MDLKTYLDQPGHTQSALAEKLSNTPLAEGVKPMKATQGLVSHWYLGHLVPTAERAIQLELATDGAVSRHEVRPDLFQPPPAPKKRRTGARA